MTTALTKFILLLAITASIQSLTLFDYVSKLLKGGENYVRDYRNHFYRLANMTGSHA